MDLEAVGGVTMGYLRFEVCRKIDDIDSTERTFLWAYTASDTKSLGDEGNPRFGGNFDA